ncbi:hypothetical protein ACHWQZ_G006505 [Mnemiopsis leidyi]
MNLENAVSSASAPFTFKWTPRQGIYKVIFYAKTADASVAGWKVNVKDTSGTVSTGQANALNTLTPCKAGDAATVGTNMVEIICDERLAATEVEISFSGVGPLELAEVVVVGKAWDAYPCALGYSSSNGFHANTGTGCQICANGQHESRSAFAATDTPTSCTACDTTKKIYYTNADDHKKQTTCQKCANHLVVLSTSESSSWTCVKCPAGQEYHTTGAGECTVTIDRSTAQAISVAAPENCDAVSCRVCEDGNRNPAESSTYCHRCEKKRDYTTDKINCLTCPDGQIADTAGTGCTNCAAGTYRGNADLECLPCAAGSMSGEGAAECTQCEEGKYEDSKTSCVDCPKGTYNELAGQSGLAQCLACDDGSVATSLGLSACAVCQPGFYGPADKTLPCVPCETGKYQDVEKQTSCKTCPAGHVPNSNKDGCVPCPMGKIPNSDQSACESCPAGTFQPETGKAECLQCGVGKITSTEGQSVCVTCEIGQEANTARTECVDCAMGMYQPDDTGGTCTNCPVGKYSDNVKSSKCTDCAVGQFQDNEGKAGCKPCPAGQYSGEAGAATCTDCASGHVTREEGMSKCVPCQPGFKANQNSAATDCDKCDPGTYQDQTGQTQCKACLANYFSSTDGQKSCKRCEDKLYAAVKSSQCLPCPAPDNSDDPVLKEKCDNDENKGCASAKYENQYGNFSHNWLEEDESADGKCGFDENQAVFKCKMIEGQLQVEETYYCKKSIKTEEIAGLAESDATAEEKTEKLVDLTEDTAMNGLGDMEAVSNVLKSIGISNETDGNNDVQPIDKKVTETILKSVSNLVQSDFKVASNETKEASDISAGVVNQVINVVKQTEVKNKVIKSPRLAVIDIKKDKDDAPAKKGIVAFSLPSSDRNSKSKGLQNCSIANEDDKEDTFLMIETKEGQNNAEMDMAVVLITDATLMPDAKISIIKQEETDQDDDTVKQILEDLKKDMEDKAAAGSSETPKKKYVNSFITEISVENPPEDFKLNLFMKPTVDIGNSSQSLNTESSGKRVEVTYICAKYVPEEMTWKEDCETIYDKARPSAGVLCLCDHNTSFAVLMSAYEIDRGYAQVQSYLTYVLLGLSTVGLLLTLVFLLPAKALRSTRSAKINICFTTALLLSSLLFLIQDAFVNAEDTGIIKLKSVGCAVYAMLQHYLWLVVFSWMVVEGFLMYLSLVQVFGSHISKYMLKFNLAAWGIPLPIPFIGYFVFTKEHTVGSFTFTDHGYLADTMCFIKPESIPFYALFLAPIVLVILINLVFFALVAKVIKNSKSSGNISDQEQILRQLKAAVGVMVLLGTGWFFGIFMSVPTPQFQVGMQYLFILLNGTQGMFVFLFYIVLNDQVKTHWLVKMGFQEEKKATTSSSAAGKSTATKATTVSVSASQNQADNIYENAAASNEEHTYASAEYATAGDKAKKHEFPAKSDNNANI